MNHGLSATLDPRGLRILKRKLMAGEISSQVFKEVLKRQMVKHALRQRPQVGENIWSNFLDSARKLWKRSEDDVPDEFLPGPLDMEELFTLARIKSNKLKELEKEKETPKRKRMRLV